MPQPDVSVIINNFNYAAFLGQAIGSALGQGAEVVVVDDGSTDGSHAVLDQFGDRVRVIAQANGGQAAAINAGVKASRGRFLCFLDSDDWFVPGKVEAVAAAFRANPRASLVYHRLQPVLSDGTPTLKPIPRALCSGDLAPRMARSAGWWPFPMTSAVSVSRAAWDAAGDIPPGFRISADAWLVGIYPFLGDVVALPESLGCYRIHANTWYRAADDAAMLRKRMAHWKAVVDATNGFLAGAGKPWRLNLEDHHPWHVAAARLNGADLPQRLRLAWQGLRFAGEPNPLRRARDVARLMSELRAGPVASQAEQP